MPPDAEIEQRVHRLIEGVRNGEEPDVAEELVAPGFRLPGHDLPEELRGPRLYRMLAEQTREAFPDLSYGIEDVLVDGEKAAVRWTMRGTHEGPLFGVAPSGRTIEVTGMEIDRFEDGQLVAAWILTDEKSILEQIGGLRPL